MPYDFNNDRKIDQAATDGYKAGVEGECRPPSKYVSDDVLMSAWSIGNNQGLVNFKKSTNQSKETKMPKFRVHIPVSLNLVVEVEAANEEEALKKGFQVDWNLNPEGAEIEECASHEDLLEGNVCHSVLAKAYVE